MDPVTFFPDTYKSSETRSSKRIEYAASSMQGHRESMEDAYSAFLNLDSQKSTSYFGVYDGHGGSAVAAFCARHMHTEILNLSKSSDDMPTVLRQAFLSMDKKLRDPSSSEELSRQSGKSYRRVVEKPSPLSCWANCLKGSSVWVYDGPTDEGSSACVALVGKHTVVVANVGNSRCILCRNGEVLALSRDHTPYSPSENVRIQNAGGFTSISRGCLRVNGVVHVSRSIGDFTYKNRKDLPVEKQIICAQPETELAMIDDAEFLVLATDGLWSTMSNQAVSDFVRARLKNGLELLGICESLLDEAVRAKPTPSIDNITVVLVKFNNPKKAVDGDLADCSFRRCKSFPSGRN